MAVAAEFSSELDSEYLNQAVNQAVVRQALSTERSMPESVRASRISYLKRRLLTSELLEELCSTIAQPPDDNLHQRISKRRLALQAYVGRYLLCAVISQPGIVYTIEIDPADGQLVHWEWQTICQSR